MTKALFPSLSTIFADVVLEEMEWNVESIDTIVGISINGIFSCMDASSVSRKLFLVSNFSIDKFCKCYCRRPKNLDKELRKLKFKE